MDGKLKQTQAKSDSAKNVPISSVRDVKISDKPRPMANRLEMISVRNNNTQSICDYEENHKSVGNPAISLVIPVYNEQANIDALIQRCLKTCIDFGQSFELILVDDGSTDSSPRIVTEAAEQNSGIVVGVLLNRNYGQHAAIMAGFAEARGDIIVTLDADLQNRPEDIPLLYDAHKRGSGDIIQAVRHPVQGLRRLYLFSRVLNFVLNLVFGMKSRDNKSGFILCRREVLARVLDHKYDYRYFQNLLGAAASTRGY